jgi:hypothetical protein
MVPLLLLAAALHPAAQRRTTYLALTPFAAGAAIYFYLAYAARDTHLHFNDGDKYTHTMLEQMSRLFHS